MLYNGAMLINNMAGVLNNIIIPLLVFSVLIVIHELGHFIAARLSGIKVEKFSIGFGPPIFQKKIKETLFLICSIPFGGYVKMAGDEKENCRGGNDEFFSKPPGIKAKVVFFGPLFNYLLSFVILWFLFVAGIPQPDSVIGGIVEGRTSKGKFDSEQIQRMIEKGIVKEDTNKEYVLWEKFNQEELYIKLSENDIKNKNDILDVWRQTQTPAKKAGLKDGDRILSINDKKINSWQDIQESIHNSGGSINITILRGDTQLEFKIIPELRETTDIFGKQKKEYVLGIYNSDKVKIVRENVFAAFLRGWKETIFLTVIFVKGLYYTIIGVIPFKESLGGPIQVFKMISEASQIGPVTLLYFLSSMGINLALINLLPVPILDGGFLFLLLIEKIRKKPLSERTEIILTRIGMAALGMLIIFVCYNDILRIITKK